MELYQMHTLMNSFYTMKWLMELREMWICENTF